MAVVSSILLWCLIVESSPRIFQIPFGNYVLPFAPMSADSAKGQARFKPELRAFMPKIVSMFEESSSKVELRDVRLAVLHDSKWLIVDKHGRATFGGRIGTCDVMGFERLIRAAPQLSFFERSVVINIELTNKLTRPITLREASGRKVFTVEPGAKSSAVTWYCPHELEFDGTSVAMINEYWERIVRTKGAANLHLSLKTIRGPSSVKQWGRDSPAGRSVLVIVE